MKPLIPRSSTMSAAEMHAANSENLARLMIYDRSKIDPLAVHLQDINTKRSRFRSPKYSNGEYVLDALRGTSVPLLVRYGEQDAVAVPNLDARETRLKEVRPDAAFEVVPGVGHWLQYEAPENFNHRTVEWVEQHIFS